MCGNHLVITARFFTNKKGRLQCILPIFLVLHCTQHTPSIDVSHPRHLSSPLSLHKNIGCDVLGGDTYESAASIWRRLTGVLIPYKYQSLKSMTSSGKKRGTTYLQHSESMHMLCAPLPRKFTSSLFLYHDLWLFVLAFPGVALSPNCFSLGSIIPTVITPPISHGTVTHPALWYLWALSFHRVQVASQGRLTMHSTSIYPAS